ncbi:MAG: IS1595 family transposase [Stellaceae bacterium]
MEISMAVKETLAQFRGAFPDEGRCEVYLFRRRWPNGFVCPNCGFGRYAALTTRGHTYECLRCHKQTSITAGTVMHRSKLPLTVWFGAIHLVTARSNDISAGELRTWLRIEKNSARLLKQKLDRLISAEHQWFESLVAVGHIQIRHHSGHCLIILAALEVNSDHIRLAAVSDGSPGAIENFILANVKPGTTLLDSKYRGLPGYDYQFIGLGTRFQNIQQVLSLAETWVNQSGTRLLHEQIDDHLQEYVVHHNRGRPRPQASFDAMIDLLLDHGPVSYWNLVGVENPRRGIPTTRRSPRRRKTATGMRQDGSGRT